MNVTNYVSCNVNGARTILKDDVLYIKKDGKHYQFAVRPLQVNERATFEVNNNIIIVNGQSFDLDALEPYAAPPKKRKRKKRFSSGSSNTTEPGFFSKLINCILEVFTCN